MGVDLRSVRGCGGELPSKSPRRTNTFAIELLTHDQSQPILAAWTKAFGLIDADVPYAEHHHYRIPSLAGTQCNGGRAERFLDRILPTECYLIKPEADKWSVWHVPDFRRIFEIERPFFLTDVSYIWTLVEHFSCQGCGLPDPPQFVLCQGYLGPPPWRDASAGNWYQEVPSLPSHEPDFGPDHEFEKRVARLQSDYSATYERANSLINAAKPRTRERRRPGDRRFGDELDSRFGDEAGDQ